MRCKEKKNDELKIIILEIEFEKWKLRVCYMRRCGKVKILNEFNVCEIVKKIKKKIKW